MKKMIVVVLLVLVGVSGMSCSYSSKHHIEPPADIIDYRWPTHN